MPLLIFGTPFDPMQRTTSTLGRKGRRGSVEQDILLFQVIDVLRHQPECLEPSFQVGQGSGIGWASLFLTSDPRFGLPSLVLNEGLESAHLESSSRQKAAGCAGQA